MPWFRSKNVPTCSTSTRSRSRSITTDGDPAVFLLGVLRTTGRNLAGLPLSDIISTQANQKEFTIALFHEDTKTVTPSGLETVKPFDRDTHTYGFSLAGNIKVGRIATWSTLLGDYTYKGLSGLLEDIKGSCKNCSACKKSCYVRASYRFPGVVQSQAINTWGLRHELKKVEADLAKQIERRHIKIARINQSGELENERQMAMWCRLAIQFPDTKFYLYTKMYDIVGKFLENGDVPPNFTILFSVWHDVGVEAYKKYSSLANVKAFVFDDGVDMCLPTKCYCPAYPVVGKTGKAKLNPDPKSHCENCRLCIDSKVKVIACHDH